MEETFCPLSPSAKARRQNIRVSRRGRQLPPSFALAEPKVGSGKRKGLVCSPLLLPVLCLSSSTPLLIDIVIVKKHLQGVHQHLPFSCGATQSGRSPSLRKKGGWKRLQVFRIYIHNLDN
jgi:hypothetical protein